MTIIKDVFIEMENLTNLTGGYGLAYTSARNSVEHWTLHANGAQLNALTGMKLEILVVSQSQLNHQAKGSSRELARNSVHAIGNGCG